MLRRDLLDIASYANGLGMTVSMNSNGYLIDAKCAAALKEAGFSKVGISIDSHIPEVHDRFRGVPGSYEQAVAALLHLRKAGIRTSISTVICTFNHEHIDQLVDFALRHQVAQLNFHNFKCSGLGLANRDELDLSPEKWQEFYRQALQVKQQVKELDISLDDPIIASLGLTGDSKPVKGSVCGKLSLNIKANGDITPCGFIPLVIGNIVSDELKEVWRTSSVLEKMRNKQPKGKCTTCGSYADCIGGCSARAFALTGDMNSPDPHCWI